TAASHGAGGHSGTGVAAGLLGDSSSNIRVTVETLEQEEKVVDDERSTIQEFKVEAGKCFKTSPDLLVLAFAGEIRKGQDTLSQHGVHSGVKIHLVITAPQNPRLIRDNWSELWTSSQEIAARAVEDLLSMILWSGLGVNTINTFLLGFILGMTGVHLLGLDSTDASDSERSVPKQRVPMHSLGPSVENVLHKADLVRDLLMSDPRMQQLAEENPELAQTFADPRTFREVLEAFSSPALTQEVMRIHDGAMRNLKSIPGGSGVLERLHRELDNNPCASLNRDPPSGAGLPAHTEIQRPRPRRASDRAGAHHGWSTGSSAGGWFVRPNSGGAEGAGGPSVVRQPAADPELMHDPRAPPAVENTPSSLRSPAAQQELLQVRWGSPTLPTQTPDFVVYLRDSPGREGMDSSAHSRGDDEVFMSDEDGSEGPVGMDEEAPQIRLRRQTEQLSAMGSRDHSANLRALVDAGEINAAVKTDQRLTHHPTRGRNRLVRASVLWWLHSSLITH
uniref:Ubiquitin-like domain-containing protein n=1 Tax=Athene cunicularia TaxID=194338 RepID=A0A663M4N6_ATHCN